MTIALLDQKIDLVMKAYHDKLDIIDKVHTEKLDQIFTTQNKFEVSIKEMLHQHFTRCDASGDRVEALLSNQEVLFKEYDTILKGNGKDIIGVAGNLLKLNTAEKNRWKHYFIFYAAGTAALVKVLIDWIASVRLP